jgi:hypothetical protein
VRALDQVALPSAAHDACVRIDTEPSTKLRSALAEPLRRWEVAPARDGASLDVEDPGRVSGWTQHSRAGDESREPLLLEERDEGLGLPATRLREWPRVVGFCPPEPVAGLPVANEVDRRHSASVDAKAVTEG